MSKASKPTSQTHENAQLSALADRVREVTRRAYGARRPDWVAVAELSLDGVPAEPAALLAGEPSAEVWSLLASLWARSSGGDPEPDADEAVWLCLHTPLEVVSAADRLWPAPSRRVLAERIARGCLDTGAARSERIALSAVLAFTTSEQAADAAARVHDESSEPLVRGLLGFLVAAREPLAGELSLRRSRTRTVLLALSGLLFLASVWRLLLRLVLGMRRRVTVALGPGGLELTEATLLLGRPVRTRERFVPTDEIAAIERETRHAGFGLYAGLFTLAVGTYVGTGLLSDALRAPGGSPTLLGIGLLVVALGLVLDFALFRFSVLRQGQARVAIQPRRGPSWVVAGSDPKHADAWLGRLRRLRGST